MNNERNEIQAEEAKIETHEEDERVLRNGTADQAKVENVVTGSKSNSSVEAKNEVLSANNVEGKEVLEEAEAESKEKGPRT